MREEEAEGGGVKGRWMGFGDRIVVIGPDEAPYSRKALGHRHGLCISWQTFLCILGKKFVNRLSLSLSATRSPFPFIRIIT